MKNKLSYFFKLRKQSDTVKMICIFALAGMACFANAAYHIWEIVHDVNTPAEYVLTGQGKISEKRMDEMRKNKAVAKVSRQIECPVSVLYGGSEAEISCTLISKEYLEEMFRTDLSAATKKIYMNETAFSDLREQLQENNEEMADLENGVKEFNIRYCIEGEASADEEEMAKNYKSAKLVVVENRGEEEEGFAYSAETDSRLQKEAVSLRVQFFKHDLDGLQVGSLRKQGYEIQNDNAVISEEYELELTQLHIRYGLLSFALCVAAAFGLKSKWENEGESHIAFSTKRE